MLKYGGAWRNPVLRKRAGRRFRPRALLVMRRPVPPGSGRAGPGAAPGGARAPPSRRARLRRPGAARAAAGQPASGAGGGTWG